MVKRVKFVVWQAVLILLAACQAVQNYPEADGPFFTGSYAETPAKFDGQLKVIAWNIRFGEQVETAIDELGSVPELQGGDILLLQEMDEAGVEAMAQKLKYNYVYFPASLHSHHHKNFGNAILSTWPITAPAKILLPYENPKNGQTRIAVRTTVAIDGMELPVYSAHTETFWLDYDKRMAQVETIIADIDPAWPNVVAAGDFNTLTLASLAEVEQRFGAADLSRAASGAETTFEWNGVGFTTDHIFAKGFAVVESGVWADTAASDHKPVWAVLQPLVRPP
jgi:endonuclease/exonuclease/phosphatase family metal-dependent hydrolase